MFRKVVMYVSKHTFYEILIKTFFVLFNLPRYLVVSIFKLGPFHISPLKSKPYCVDIIYYLNSRTFRNSVLDVGCGLGDILRNLRYENRFGMDHSPNVLDALNFIQRLTIRKNRLVLSEYKFESDEIKGNYCVIIIVNFIHKFPPDFLREKLEKIYKDNLEVGGEIIFDIIEKSTKSHPYAHRVKNLNYNMNARVKIIGRYRIHLQEYKDLYRQVISFTKTQHTELVG